MTVYWSGSNVRVISVVDFSISLTFVTRFSGISAVPTRSPLANLLDIILALRMCKFGGDCPLGTPVRKGKPQDPIPPILPNSYPFPSRGLVCHLGWWKPHNCIISVLEVLQIAFFKWYLPSIIGPCSKLSMWTQHTAIDVALYQSAIYLVSQSACINIWFH